MSKSIKQFKPVVEEVESIISGYSPKMKTAIDKMIERMDITLAIIGKNELAI